MEVHATTNIGTISHFAKALHGTKSPGNLLALLVLSLVISFSQASFAAKVCVLSGGMDREVRIENCGTGQTVLADGTVNLSKDTIQRLDFALKGWERTETLDLKKPMPISFLNEKSASPLMFGPRLGYLLKTEKGFVVRQIAFFDNGPDYFEGSTTKLARFIARNGKIGFLNEKLETIIPALFDFATPFSAGYSVVCYSKKTNPCIRRKSEEEEYSTVDGGSWAVIEKTGKTVRGPGLKRNEAYTFAAEKKLESQSAN